MGGGLLSSIRTGKDESELLERMRSGTDNRREFDWPGKPGVRVAVRLLSAEETRKARFENQQEFDAAKVDVSIHNLTDYRAQEAAHGLWKALIDPATGLPLFSSVEKLRSFVSDDELSFLSKEYNALCDFCDPCATATSEEDHEALLGMLKKTPDLIPGKVSDLRLAWKLLRISVSQPIS